MTHVFHPSKDRTSGQLHCYACAQTLEGKDPFAIYDHPSGKWLNERHVGSDRCDIYCEPCAHVSPVASHPTQPENRMDAP